MVNTYVPFLDNPFPYINGLGISNHASAPNTKITIATGQCRDASDTYQLTSSSALTVDSAVDGLGGLDTGDIAASTLYSVYLVADTISSNRIGAMISASATAPIMPFGYNAYKKIGYVRTDGSSNFLAGYWSGDYNNRVFMYDAPIATAVTAGNATSFTAASLATFVPAINGIPAIIASAFTPGAASRTLSLSSYGATGTSALITGQVTSVVVSTNSRIISTLNSTAPSIYYKVANSGDAVALNVAGYEFYV